jgi:hypothetical protein
MLSLHTQPSCGSTTPQPFVQYCLSVVCPPNKVTGSIQWANYCSWLVQSLLILLSTTVSCCQSSLLYTLCSRNNATDFPFVITCPLPRVHVRTGASDIAVVTNSAEFNAVVWPRPISYPSFSLGLEFPPLTPWSLHALCNDFFLQGGKNTVLLIIGKSLDCVW